MRKYARHTNLVVLVISAIMGFFFMPAGISGQPSFAKDTTRIAATEKPVILYELSAIDGEIILMSIKYSARIPDSEILDVRFDLPRPKADGTQVYFINAKDNERLKLTFYYKNSNLANVHVDAAYLPQEAFSGGKKTYAVLSQKGDKINFEFHWLKDAAIDYVKIFPAVNPFAR